MIPRSYRHAILTWLREKQRANPSGVLRRAPEALPERVLSEKLKRARMDRRNAQRARERREENET